MDGLQWRVLRSTTAPWSMTRRETLSQTRRWAMEDLEAAREDLFEEYHRRAGQHMVRACDRAGNRGRHGGACSASMTN